MKHGGSTKKDIAANKGENFDSLPLKMPAVNWCIVKSSINPSLCDSEELRVPSYRCGFLLHPLGTESGQTHLECLPVS